MVGKANWSALGFRSTNQFQYYIFFHFAQMNVWNTRVFIFLILLTAIPASICGWEACEECVDARSVIPHWEGNKV